MHEAFSNCCRHTRSELAYGSTDLQLFSLITWIGLDLKLQWMSPEHVASKDGVPLQKEKADMVV